MKISSTEIPMLVLLALGEIASLLRNKLFCFWKQVVLLDDLTYFVRQFNLFCLLKQLVYKKPFMRLGMNGKEFGLK